MRLFKFLVISNEIMEKSKMIKPVVRVRLGHHKDGTLKASKSISTTNEFYFYCHDLHKIQYDLLTQHNIVGSKSGIVLMSLDYPNELVEFRNKNKAYVIIDPDNVDEVMKLIAPTEKRNFIKYDNRFQGCSIKVCSDCSNKNYKLCSNISMEIIENKRYIRGKLWSFANDTAGTKKTIHGITRDWEMEAKTGGMVYCSIHWRKDFVADGENGEISKISFKPEGFVRKAVYIPLNHWIKCNSVPNKEHQKGKYPFYHIGHIFDNRNNFIGINTLEEIEKLRKKCEPLNEIRRGRRVLAAQEKFSRSIKCKDECFNQSKGASCEAARKCVMFPLENGSYSIFISKLLTYSRKILSGNA